MTHLRLSSPTTKISNKRYHFPWMWLVLILSALGIAFIPFPIGNAQATEQHFQITASSYEYSPATIRVNPGDRVTFELVSTDVVHGIYIDGYDIELIADPGKTARMSFTADQPGTFRFRCSVTCGALHPFMIGKLYVGPNTLLWKTLGIATLVAFAGLWVVKK
jgi:heme/copper-type cytochrome/quinol oxidase subunit 2